MDATAEKADESGHGSVLRYVICWAVLAVLTGTTWALSSVELGEWSLVIALFIAVVKGATVALFFMHLWDQKGASRLVFVTSLVFVMLLMTLVVADVATRFPAALPPR